MRELTAAEAQDHVEKLRAVGYTILRYAFAPTLGTTMKASDVTATLDLVRAKAGVDEVRGVHRPRLLSDNGHCCVSANLATYLGRHGMEHTREAPYHPQTRGKIESYHRSMKNVVKLENYYRPWELEGAISRFVEHYNHRRYHESLEDRTPADACHGRRTAILTRREQIKNKRATRCKRQNLSAAQAGNRAGSVSYRSGPLIPKPLTKYTASIIKC